MVLGGGGSMRLSSSSTGTSLSLGASTSSLARDVGLYRDSRLLLKLVIVGQSDGLNDALQTRMAHAPSGATTFSTHYCTKFGRDFRVRDVFIKGHRLRVQIFKETPSQRLDSAPSLLLGQGGSRKGRRPPVWDDAQAVLYTLDRRSKDAVAAANETLAWVKSASPFMPRALLVNEKRLGKVPPPLEEELTVLAQGQGVPLHQVSISEGSGVESAFLAAVEEALKYKLMQREEEADVDSGVSLDAASSASAPSPLPSSFHSNADCRVS